MENNFIKLSEINVNNYTEKVKNGAKENKYLSWAYAWAEFCKIYKNATYSIRTDEKGNCYFGNGKIGYMVYVKVNNGEGLEHEMFLPVMDSLFNIMKDESYEYTTRFGTKKVESIDMFYINKSIMRCLVKCIAMFGLGLYIYTGEDLPNALEEVKIDKVEIKKELTEEEKKEKAIKLIEKLCVKNGLSYDESIFKKMDINELTEQYNLLKG